MLLKWDDAYTVGHSGIDEQHKKLFVALNRLIALIDSPPTTEDDQDPAVLAAAAAFFDEFCRHSEKEEAFMQEFQYPHTERHAHHHAFFISALKTLLVDDPKLKAIQTGMPFITSTVLDHIDRDDRDFGGHLLSLGLYGKA